VNAREKENSRTEYSIDVVHFVDRLRQNRGFYLLNVFEERADRCDGDRVSAKYRSYIKIAVFEMNSAGQ
jgi:hypothetical protein